MKPVSNGVIPVTTVPLVVPSGGGGGIGLQTSLTILKSTVPYLLFLLLYGLNQQLHILPRFTDLDCIYLHNVSGWEQLLLHASPHRLISSHSSPVLDLLSAVPYLLHYVIPVLYPLYLYCHGHLDDIARFYWLLGWTMWIHYIVWFALPTAPPWVYDNWSRFANSSSPPPPLYLQHKEGCAFARLDARTGLPFFFNMFASNPVPFASFPSGHVAWATCMYLTCPPGGRLFALYIVWVAWATLYSCHHYLSDAVCAVLLVAVTRRLLMHLHDRRPREQFTCPAIVCPLNMV